tara:strand:+ start:1675 stop:2538 length:864 start_codon:yes stop_codon:yes gene_type:complete
MLRRLASWWREDTDNNNPNLSQLKLFKLAYLLPTLTFAIFSVLIFHAEQLWTYDICFRSACIFNTYEIFKIPVWLLALSLPLTGLVAAHHRSVQTSKQIDLTMENNTFSNYYKHIEHFENRYKNFEVDLDLYNHNIVKFEFSSIANLYVGVFPFNFPHDFKSNYRGDHLSGLENALARLQIIFEKPIDFKNVEKNQLDPINSQNLFSSLYIREAIVNGETYNLRPTDLFSIEWDRPSLHITLIMACLKLVISLNKFSSSKIPMSYTISTSSGLATVDFKGKDFSKSL